MKPSDISGSKIAAFFISTGRCGTQWLQKAIAATYPEHAVVTHEPVRGIYEPRRYLRAYDRLDDLLASERVREHLGFVRETLIAKSYIETGWPSYPAVPLFIEQLGPRIKVVHLVRHPVPTALSLATHDVYGDRTDWLAGAAITPFDEGVIQKDLRAQWGTMSGYEKCLFWWTEINLYALELAQRYPDIDFHFARYEELFDRTKPALRSLIRFLELPEDESIEMLREEREDRYRRKVNPIDWQVIARYERTVALAGRFGYEIAAVSPDEIAARYFPG